MDLKAINSEGNISYQPLQNQEDEEDATEISFMDPPNIVSARHSWNWYSFGATNYVDAASQARKAKGHCEQNVLKKKWKRAIKKYIGGLLIILVLLSVGIWVCLQLVGSTRLKEISNHIINKFSFGYPENTTVDDSTENWVKYVHEFSSSDGIGPKTVFTSPYSSLVCSISHNGQIPSILINSSFPQNWSHFQIDKQTCSDHLLTEKLALTGYFTKSDLRHIFTEIPFIVSLKLSSLELVTHHNEEELEDSTEKIELVILTTLTITDGFDSNLLDWIDQTFDLPFLSEILVWKSHLIVTPLNNLLEKSSHLKSLFLIENTISCDTGKGNTIFNCPPINKLPSLVELTLINRESKLDTYWGSFITSMLLNVEYGNRLNILETNVPVDENIISDVIETELATNSSQVYEIIFRLPTGMKASSKINFVKRHITYFEERKNNNETAKCQNSKSLYKTGVSNDWVNLCRDSEKNTIFFGFGKGTYVNDNQLTVFVRRAATGNIKCSGDVNNHEAFFCKSTMKH